MPRRPCILLANYPLHIVQWGIDREPWIFAGRDEKESDTDPKGSH
jgi:hypothetical protein